MASSGNPNPNTPAPFDIAMFFRAPNPNPNPNAAVQFFSAPSGPPSYHPLPPPPAFHLRPGPLPPPSISNYPSQNPSANFNHGARLMQLLGNSVPGQLDSVASAPPGGPAGVPSNKLPRGRALAGGSHAFHDVDSRLVLTDSPPPQLEVTPITKYTSDPGLVLGRQIAVNSAYIVYGLKQGNIRVINVDTALRSLLKGHTQRVTEVAFFAQDVHLLASVSVDGRFFVWKIEEGFDEENKPEIVGKVVIALHIFGHYVSYHPRVCWHPHKQEILFVAMGNSVLRVDTTKVGKGRQFTTDDPLKCNLETLIDGVYLVGKHENEITDLSISQWMTTRLASASKDGVVKIWDDSKVSPLSLFLPHGGKPVHAVVFLTSPCRPDHVNLITAGPSNQQLKIWASTNEEGWLLPNESESWRCTQTLDLISSKEPNLDEAFFNQVYVLPLASIILLANAKKNALYVVHFEYGPNPSSTHMDYIADFAVTMPILSFMATLASLPGGEQAVQVYCVQTLAIQQYSLELSRCLPATIDDDKTGKEVMNAEATPGAIVENSSATKLPVNHWNSEEAVNSHNVASVGSELAGSGIVVPKSEFVDAKPSALPVSRSDDELSKPFATKFPPIPSVELLETQTSINAFLEQSAARDLDVDQRIFDYPTTGADSIGLGKDDQQSVSQTDVSNPLMFNAVGLGCAAHMVSPSNALLGALFPESSDVHVGQIGCPVRVPDIVGGSRAQHESDAHKNSQFAKEKTGIMNEARSAKDTYNAEDLQSSSEKSLLGSCEKLPTAVDDNDKKVIKDLTPNSTMVFASLAAVAQKGKSAKYQIPVPFYSTNSFSGPEVSAKGAALPQLSSMQDMLQQIMNLQNDLQKQLDSVIAGSISKECMRMETLVMHYMENSVKSNVDALWARFHEDGARREKVDKERMVQINTLITNCINKDLPTMLERTMKKEISALGPLVSKAITPVIEKSIASAVADSVQKGLGERVIYQLERSINSKLDASLTRQIGTQFQTTGKQALQDSLRSCFELAIIPAFQQSCKAMFEQVDFTFQKGLSEHVSALQKQIEVGHTPLALTLKDTLNSASLANQSLVTELLDGQRKLLALVASGNSKAQTPAPLQAANIGTIPSLNELLQVEAPRDPLKELSRLISERKFEEAFMMALQKSDVGIVSWLSSQVDLHGLCSVNPPVLGQGILIALLQQLSCDIGNDTPKKVQWMTDVAVAINPVDPLITQHVRPIFEQVYKTLSHQRALPVTAPTDAASIRLLMHVLNSVLLSQ